MSVERPRVPSAEGSPKEVTLHVSLSNTAEGPIQINVPQTLFERIAGKLEERGIEPKYVAAGAVVFVAAASAGVAAKKIIDHQRKPPIQEPPVSVLTEAQKGEYERMYKDSYPTLRNFIRNRLPGSNQDVEDLTQTVLKNACEHFPPDYTFPELPNPHSPWLYRIAANLIKNRLRDASRKTEHEADIDVGEILYKMEDPTPDMDTMVTSHEEAVELQKAVASLKDPYALVIWLKVALEWSNEEIAHTLETTESAIKSTYHRALQSLRKKYLKSSANPKD